MLYSLLCSRQTLLLSEERVKIKYQLLYNMCCCSTALVCVAASRAGRLLIYAVTAREAGGVRHLRRISFYL